MTGYDPKNVEEDVLRLWSEQGTYELAKERARGPKFYFLDGPPYANGKVHAGHAWNKSLKDMVLRYKRMRGFRVWDRAGYDMHGLPTENATMKKLGLKTNDDIMAFGRDKFLDECRKLCLENLKVMNEDFKRLGVWMDFENAYQSITKRFMSGEWWLIKRAYEQGRLYEGLRTMTWCRNTESAIAKHELEYHTVRDESVFIKLPLSGRDGEFLVVWTTTPWTIPFNLAVMAGPDITYAKVKVGSEYWYVAEALVGAFLGSLVDEEYEVVETIKGSEMAGWRYEHPYYESLKHYFDPIIKESESAFSVLLSQEHVDTSAGTGLVHTAPGCGPEDYEVGHKHGIKPFNTIDPKGVFPDDMGPFSGLVARVDDKRFVERFEEDGVLVAKSVVEHEYPHDWRYHEPVIFRTTKQWFFKMEDLKEQLIEGNDSIAWRPKAAYRAFDNWLRNLRDNSISKQRFWGCPLPIWRSADDPEDIIVVGSAEELEELSGSSLDDLHISSVDTIVLERDGTKYHRVRDVLDVWVDAGTVSWNCLDQDADLIKEYFPADFILEGKDQVRGWFNLLHVAGMLGYGTPAFKACYMHGFINDAHGQKMSKSLGNTTAPQELIGEYGADAMRYYMIGSASPGLDMNLNLDDLSLKRRNLQVFWNVKNYLFDLQRTHGLSLRAPKETELCVEERYILSRYHRTVKQVTQAFDEYRLNEVPHLLEECLLSLSRTYIKLVREKASTGSRSEREVVLWTAWSVYKGCMTMFSTIAPFITERSYQDARSIAKNPFLLFEESVHLESWPEFDESFVDEALERGVEHAQDITSAILYAREKAGLGVRWPLPRARVETQDDGVEEAVRTFSSLVKGQANVKELVLEKAPVKIVIKPDFKAIGKSFGEETPQVVDAINGGADAISEALSIGEEEFNVEGFALTRDMLQVSYEASEGEVVEFSGGLVAIDTVLDKRLEDEGFVRELTRRVQQWRKEEGLEKRDRISIGVSGPKERLEGFAEYEEHFQEVVGASKLHFSQDLSGYDDTLEVSIRGESFMIGLSRA